MPSEIGWGEALDLVGILAGDPSSQTAAAMLGLDYPLAREGWMVADLIDLQGFSKYGKKWKATPRPFRPPSVETSNRGDAAGRTPEEVKAILATQFGQSEDPASA